MATLNDIHETLGRIEKRQKRIYREIFEGNGRPPILSRIAALEASRLGKTALVSSAIMAVGGVIAAIVAL